MGKTSTQSKDKYNENAYARYTVRLRKDSDINDAVEKFMATNGTSFNYLVTELLKKHFEKE